MKGCSKQSHENIVIPYAIGETYRTISGNFFTFFLKPAGYPNSSREGNPLLVGARAKQHQDYMTMGTNGGLEADAQCCGENWLSQVHQRQQALTSLYSICNETVREEAFSTNSFCRLFSQEVCRLSNVWLLP